MATKKYDEIVVGSGISGLTAALLLAKSGREVLLLEKAPRLGGSLTRFRRRGATFDTGFHFTGAFCENGVLRDMLGVLGIDDLVEPYFLSSDRAHRFVFESEDMTIDLPSGVEGIAAGLKDHFPGEAQAVDGYFRKMRQICGGTAALDLTQLSSSPRMLDEDYVTLQEVLDGLTSNRLLQSVLCGFSMCYGVMPREVSFADHCRMCVALYESVARVKGGGDAFIDAFRRRFERAGVEVRCGTWIEECLDVSDDRVRRFRLNTGEEVEFGTCVLTIHPRLILDLLPEEHLSKAFVSRVSAFEGSAGFFSIFGLMDAGKEDMDCASTIVSLFPVPDVNNLLDPSKNGDSALVVLSNLETIDGRPRQVLTAFETSFPGRVEKWRESRTGRRPQEYLDYKAARSARIHERITSVYPEYGDGLKILDSASILTFRDYLNSPDGSAYGIKQKMGQYNLIGKLPLRNLYAAGQSAMLPGVVGAMMSSFMATRAVIGKDAFSALMEGGKNS